MREAEAISTLVSGIRRRSAVRLDYGGHRQVVEVHAVGYGTMGDPLARVYHLSGASDDGGTSPWRTVWLENVVSAEILDLASLAPREGFRPGDGHVPRIVAEVL